MKAPPNAEAKYAAMGMAALLPGMQYMLEQLQFTVDKFRAELARLQAGEAPRAKRGGPPSAKSKAKNPWAGMSAEERSAEMHRRMKVRLQKKATHPRDPNHPGHAEWLEKLRKIQTKAWDSMSPAKQKARIKAMEAGKARARKQKKAAATSVVELEKTA